MIKGKFEDNRGWKKNPTWVTAIGKFAVISENYLVIPMSYLHESKEVACISVDEYNGKVTLTYRTADSFLPSQDTEIVDVNDITLNAVIGGKK